MRNVRRYFKEGQCCFLTHVTYQRKPILVKHVELLMSTINQYRKQIPFDLVAWVVLPDHWHCIVDPCDNDLAALMKKIKLSFAQKYLKAQGTNSGRTWHNRYWDHIIRDERDMNRHLDYIHYNPVKHGLVDASANYLHSSFAKYVAEGLYPSGWGSTGFVKIEGEFGE